MVPPWLSRLRAASCAPKNGEAQQVIVVACPLKTCEPLCKTTGYAVEREAFRGRARDRAHRRYDLRCTGRDERVREDGVRAAAGSGEHDLVRGGMRGDLEGPEPA